MKIFCTFLAAFLLVNFHAFAQDKTWQIELKPQGAVSESYLAIAKENSPEFSNDYISPFLAGNKPSSIAVILTKGQAKTTMDRLIQHFNYTTKKFYSYHLGDDVILGDSISKVFEPAKEGNLLSDGPNFVLINKLSDTKEIAGYSCNLTELEVGIPYDGSLKVKLWHTTALPSYTLTQLPFLEFVEGAVLGIELLPFDRPDVGYFAEQVKTIPSTPTNFELPKDMDILEMEDLLSSVDDSIEAEDYSTIFPLAAGYRYHYTEDANYGPVFSIQDSNGKAVLEGTFYSLEKIGEDCALLMNTDNKFWLIDPSVKLRNKDSFDQVYALGNNNLVFVNGENSGVLTNTGEYLIQHIAEIDYIQDGKYIFKRDGKYGILSEDAVELLKPTFTELNMPYGDPEKALSINYQLPGKATQNTSIEAFFKLFKLD
ncbi:hypothetical protein J5U18_03845 [Sphingobacteriaceae bacterium WQ 2009]|uniref:GLPGLI family protein n=1 Tax=Rhinopithecimicrobium faecis TaxID=2820698 RepID=A0A8T4H8K4_9SPHI|nr:hypothetical protein [Sphingobacteriaceae bacterium WQ 2009]